MMIRNIIRGVMVQGQYGFASSAAAIDYYKLLGVEKAATTDEIRKAYDELNKSISPDTSPKLFSKISEAFVILSNVKARDAYDSLLKSRKTSYLNDPVTSTPKSMNFATQQRNKSREELRKKYNIDAFGRYRGGLPNRKGEKRGSALGEPGAMYNPADIHNKGDKFPDYDHVDAHKAESFKVFHEDEREFRTTKWPWTTLHVDYNFFRMGENWRFFKNFVYLLFIFPVLAHAIYRYGSRLEHLQNHEKAVHKRKENFLKQLRKDFEENVKIGEQRWRQYLEEKKKNPE